MCGGVEIEHLDVRELAALVEQVVGRAAVVDVVPCAASSYLLRVVACDEAHCEPCGVGASKYGITSFGTGYMR